MSRFLCSIVVISFLVTSCASTRSGTEVTDWQLTQDERRLHDAYVQTFVSVASGKYSEFRRGMKTEELRESIPELRMDRVSGKTEFYSALFDSDTFSPLISANFVVEGDEGLVEVEFFSDQVESKPDGQILRSIFFDTTNALTKIFGEGVVENRLIDTRLSTAGKSWMEVSAENHRLLDSQWKLGASEALPSVIYLDCDTANSRIGYFRLVVHY